MASKSGIEVGHRFRDVQLGLFGRPRSIWIVGKLFTGRDAIDYAHLVCASDHTEKKTLSLDALRDPKRFVTAEN